MQLVTIDRFSFGSFVKLSSLSSLSFGLVFGFFFLLGGLLNGNVTVNGNPVFDYGTKIITGLSVFVVVPFLFGLMGSICGLLAYWPFTFLLKRIHGLKLEYTPAKEGN